MAHFVEMLCSATFAPLLTIFTPVLILPVICLLPIAVCVLVLVCLLLVCLCASELVCLSRSVRPFKLDSISCTVAPRLLFDKLAY